ncbi:hypothetical protein ARMSODRAFT_1009864 [Armillaria solidipes]|uniref:DUF6534 domain-containing protein n=1 Tax=Armillaria solidipes TaxID=1076256 RepID=A0A2H3AN52_9AGAR|nr:hypothetical protein ARMSODRAFT_1009864 [Armillaria solidipes]
MSSQSSTVFPSVSETLGALYVGVTIAAVLYGVTNLQSVMYYRRYPSDWWVYRYSVGLLWVLDTVHVALSVYAVYFFLIHFFGDLNGALQYVSWSIKVNLFDCQSQESLMAPEWCTLVAFFSESLSRCVHPRPVCPPTMAAFVFSAVMIAIAVAYCVHSRTTFSQNCHLLHRTAIYLVYDSYTTPNLASASSMKTSVHVFFSTIAVADLIIAIPMFYYLHKSRAIILVPSTATVLLCLMRLVVMSGLATSACSLLTLISYIAWRKSLAFLGINFVLSKLYINSLLAMLNSRSEHHSTKKAMESEVNSLDAGIAPHSPESDISETNISIPLPDIRSVNNKLGPSREDLDSRV